MSTPTAAELINRIRHSPELMEDIRQLLNKEAGYTTQTVHTSPKLSHLGRPNSNKERDIAIAARIWAGEKRREIAIEYQLSLPRINQIAAEYPNPNPKPKASINAERDRLILDAARNKVPRAEIARKHNLSVIRVNQIVGAAPKAKKLTRAEKIAEALRKYDAYEDLTFEDECLIMLAKYDTIARRITQRIIEGANMGVLFDWEYPADCTGGDIKWTIEHYQAIAEMMYHFESGIWKM